MDWRKKREQKHAEKRAEEVKQIKAYVATPAYEGKVETDYAISLAEACQYATHLGIHVTTGIMANGAFIDLARNNFAHLFLQTDCTHLFFIDSDLKFESRAFIGLLTAGRPICAGVYPRRQNPPDYPVRYIEAENGGIQTVDGGWVLCDRVPTGFLCIERRVIEEMSADAMKVKQGGGQPPVARLFYTKITDEMAFMGEDYCFCEDYTAKYKQPIYVWPDFDFVHGRIYEGNWHKHMNEQATKFRGAQFAVVENG